MRRGDGMGPMSGVRSPVSEVRGTSSQMSNHNSQIGEGNSKITNRKSPIANHPMARSPDHPIIPYQLVIDPSGRCSMGIGRLGSVISAASCSGLMSSVTPRPGRRFGHSLPWRKS